MRLNKKLVISLLEQNEVLTPKQLSELTGASYSASVKMLKRLEKEGVVKGEFDWSGGHSYEKYYALEVKTEINPEKIISEVVDYMKRVDHPYLRMIPEKYGGKQTKGSGWLSAWRGLIEVLQEMGKL